MDISFNSSENSLGLLHILFDFSSSTCSGTNVLICNTCQVVYNLLTSILKGNLALLRPILLYVIGPRYDFIIL